MSRPHLPRNHRDRRYARTDARRARPAPEPLEDRTLLAFGLLTEYPLPTRPGQPADASSNPWDITAGPDHNVWFTEQDPKYGNRIGRITSDGTISEFSQGISAMAWPSGISANPYDNRVYFTEFRGNRVGVLDTSQLTISELPLMPDDSQPAETFFVEPNDVYISQSNSNGFSELDIFANPTFIPCDSSSSCPTPSTPNSGPWGMASDRNDYFYFTERFAGRIGVFGIDASSGQGKTFEFETPSHRQGKPSQPLSIVEGPDGNLWYTDYMADAIGKITPLDPKTNQVTITEYPLAAGSRPWGITPGPGGFLYFTEYGGNAIERIDPGSGAIEVDPLPHPKSGPRGIAVDSNGILWFTESDGNRIGEEIVLNFTPQQSFPAGEGSTFAALGDFNGDDKPDLAVTNRTSNDISVFLNTTAAGATVPSFAPQQVFPGGAGPSSAEVGDFNGDGKPDLAVANSAIVNSQSNISVLLNTTAAGSATLSFAPQQFFPVGVNPSSVAVGDFNGDGKPDLAVANFLSESVSVLLNTTAAGATTPSFAPQQSFAAASGDSSVAVGDFNNDGKPDLATSNQGFPNTASVLLNTTTAGATVPSFAPQRPFPAGGNPASVAVGDFNNDGKPDLAVANFFSGNISVLLNTTAAGSATPSFAPQRLFSAGGHPSSVAVGDFNGDGKPDLAVAVDNVSVLLNTTAAGSATPSFTLPQPFPAGSEPMSASVGDLNGDGKPDLAVANLYPGSVSVLLNTSPQVKSPAQLSSPTAAYLRDAFERLTGRPLADSRLAALLKLVSTHLGSQPATLPRPIFLRLARTLLHSPEFREREVRNLYRTLFRRPVTLAEIQAGVATLSRGGSVLRLQAMLLSSPAYFRQRGGGNRAGFFRAAFGDTRHRAPTPAELRRWVGLLRDGTPRPVVAAALVRGAAATADVQYWYLRLLDRPPTRAEARLWSTALMQGGRLEALILNLVTSHEFRLKVS